MFKEFASKAVEYFKESGIGSRFMEAYKKAKESKDSNWFEKVGIFFKSFMEEVKVVDQEKDKVTAETTAAVARTVDDTLKGAKETVAFSEDVNEADREFFDEILAMGVSSLKDLDDDAEAKAHSGLKKIDKAAKGEEQQELDIEESMSVAAVGMTTLRQLRKRYGKEEDFKQALDRIVALSDKSKYPLKTLLTTRVLGLFRIKSDSEGLKFLSRFGIEATAADLMGNGEASHAKQMLESLTKRPVENIDEVADFMKKHFFQNTPKGDVKVAVNTLSELIVEDESELKTDKLAKLAFLINDSDYEHLINALIGRQTALADAA